MPYRIRREYYRKRKKKGYTKKGSKLKNIKNTLEGTGNFLIGLGVVAVKGGQKAREILRKRREKAQAIKQKHYDYESSKYASQHANERPSYMKGD